jgi:hypothetical protein
MKMMTRDEMLTALRSNICTVTFEKMNGDERVMECTLNMSFIPENMRPKTDGNLAEGVEATIDVVKAYDLRAAGWRSFKVDKVKAFAA